MGSGRGRGQTFTDGTKDTEDADRDTAENGETSEIIGLLNERLRQNWQKKIRPRIDFP